MTTPGQGIQIIKPGTFESSKHWYPKALKATIHPMINFFLRLDNKRIADRYCQLHPTVKAGKLNNILNYQSAYYRWAGADLINVTNAEGERQMVVIENNSCPSGQKSMPLPIGHSAQGGYRDLIEKSFRPFCKSGKLGKNDILAVLYDKNIVETSGYAAVMADIFERPVYLVHFPDKNENQHIRFKNDFIEILVDGKNWKPVTAAFRYVTAKPWNRIPVHTTTKIFNPILACLAGGRNKLVASKAYDAYNDELNKHGLKIRTPETVRDVTKEEVPFWVKKFGGQAVIKVPYSNAGQGVFTIVSKDELDAFMAQDFEYSRFIVQSLIGNYRWTSRTSSGNYFHLGTLPNADGDTFVFDLRMMVCSTPDGFRPICIYSRRAEQPLSNTLRKGDVSWDMLGTNLSYKNRTGEWNTDINRLILMDRMDFEKLGLGLDDLIEAYIQSVLSTIAIDLMAKKLVNSKGKFRTKLFSRLNDDPQLLHEIIREA